MNNEPARFEIFLTKLAFIFYGKSIYKAFADRLPLNGSEQVLDFGCGMGTVAFYTARRITHGQLTCLDISERWLTHCRKRLRCYKNVSFMNVEAQSLTERNYDIIYCHFVLHDISEIELENVIHALAKALRFGGILIFREPLKEVEKLSLIKRLIKETKLSHKESRVIFVPLMGSTLEGIYIKQ